MNRPLVERGTGEGYFFSKQRACLQATRNIVRQIVIVQQYEQYPGYQRFFSRARGIFGDKDLTETRNRARKVSGTHSLQCRRFFRARKCFCSRQRHVETEERRKWGESKGAGRGRGERREYFFPTLHSFLLSPSHLP